MSLGIVMAHSEQRYRNLIVAFVGALAAIASLTIVSQVLLHKIVGEKSPSARVINIAGRQRMLSQRIGLLAKLYREGDITVKPELLELVTQMETSHLALLKGNIEQNLNHQLSPALQQLYFGDPQHLDRRTHDYLEVVRTLINSNNEGERSAAYRRIEQFAQSGLLSRLDRAVDLFESEATQDINTFKQTQQLIVGLLLLILILQALFIFRPLVKIVKLEKQLQLAKAELETRVKERTQQLLTTNQSLLQMQERLELALEASDAGWWHWQVQTGDLEWSPSYSQMFGFEEEDLQANYKIWESLVHLEDLPWVNEKLNAHLQDSSVSYAFDYRLRSPSGEWKWIANLGKVVERDKQGQPVRMAGMHLDISDRKQAEEQLQQINRELQRSNEELGQFAYVASHDLQEPLRMVKSFTELLARRYQGQLDDKADRYMDYITDGAMRMQTLISDLLAYSRAGRFDLALQPTHLEEVVEQVRSDLQTVIQTKDAKIEMDSLPTLHADPTQMRQLMQNLIANAIKYCEADFPIVQIRATSAQDSWTISVQDNGIGIDPQYAERIFVIFQRLHNKDDYSGTGIGLAICKKIVERHGGTIWVDSQAGEGATFSFTMPIA